VNFQIKQELGAKPKTSKEGDYTPGLTEWLVSTLLLVRAEEYSDGTRAEHANYKARDRVLVKLSGGRIVQATIKAIIETTDGVRLQVSFGDETARIYEWQIVETID
jgi:hypothetical protein